MTEPSFDPVLDELYADTVIFSPVEEMCGTIERLLAQEEVLAHYEVRSRRKYLDISNNVFNFSRAINQALSLVM